MLGLLLAAYAAVSLAGAAEPREIAIAGERVFPESITAAADGSVIIGGLGTHAVYRARPGSATAEVWIQPGTDGIQAVLGVFADDASHTLWACSASPGATPSPPPPPSALYAFDLASGAPKGRYPMPTAGALCNDIATGANGTVYVTDTRNMEIARLTKGAKALDVWAGNGAFGAKDGVLDGIAILGQRVIVNALTPGKLFSVPIGQGGKAGAVVEIKLTRALARPDGMRAFGKNGLLVAESGDGGRLARVILNGDSGTVTSLKEGFPEGAVSVAVVGTTAYVLEGQLAVRSQTGAVLKPFRATGVAVGKP